MGTGRPMKIEKNVTLPKTVFTVVLFAKVRGLVMFECPRTQRVHGLSDFTSPRIFIKSTTTKTVLR